MHYTTDGQSHSRTDPAGGHRPTGGWRGTRTAQRATVIHTQLASLWIPGSLRELRIVGTSCGVVAGLFDDPRALARAAAPCVGRAQLYLTANLVEPTLPERLGYTTNRLIVHPRSLTGDADIARRVLIFIDADPVRDPHLSASDPEHDTALARVAEMAAWLVDVGVPSAAVVTVDSGNGGYVLLRIDLRNTPEARCLVARVTRTLASRFTDAQVMIDRAVTNAARLMKLPGTLAMKGPHTQARPHRPAVLLQGAALGVTTPASVLAAIAALASDDPPPPADAVGIPYRGPAFDLDRWLSAYAAQLPPMSQWRAWRTASGEGRKRVFIGCPFASDHAMNQGAFIGQMPSGAIVARCLHAAASTRPGRRYATGSKARTRLLSRCDG